MCMAVGFLCVSENGKTFFLTFILSENLSESFPQGSEFVPLLPCSSDNSLGRIFDRGRMGGARGKDYKTVLATLQLQDGDDVRFFFSRVFYLCLRF